MGSNIVAFGSRRSAPDRLTKTDRTALIALGYALGGSWRTEIEVDEGGEWAVICPRRDDLAAAYLVLPEGTRFELIDSALCLLGTFERVADLAAEVRRRERSGACATQPGGTR